MKDTTSFELSRSLKPSGSPGSLGMSGRLLRLSPALCGLLLAAGASTAFRACAIKEDGTWMHCHTAQNAVVAGGLLLCVLFLAAAFTSVPSRRRLLYGLGILGSVFVFFLPGNIISMCMMHTMRCYAVLQPYCRILSALAAATALINAVTSGPAFVKITDGCRDMRLQDRSFGHGRIR